MVRSSILYRVFRGPVITAGASLAEAGPTGPERVHRQHNNESRKHMNIKEVKKGDKILHSHLGTQPPVSGVVMESPKQGRGVRSTILVNVKGSEVGLFDEVGSIYTSEILKVFRDDNWLPVEQ